MWELVPSRAYNIPVCPLLFTTFLICTYMALSRLLSGTRIGVILAWAWAWAMVSFGFWRLSGHFSPLLAMANMRRTG